MSILSELGKFIGQKHLSLFNQIKGNEDKITTLQQQIIDLQLQTNLMQITGSVHNNDISILNSQKGVVLQSEDYTKYRLRITNDKKLIIDDVTNNTANIAEIQLTTSNPIDEIGEMTIGEDFEIT